jgi:predicted RNA-binding Zn-ribbon protein involved in translation (DUF1610 family)
MALAAIQVEVTLEQFVCGECGGTYAIATRYAEQKRKHAGFWHCPYCQTNWGFQKGDLQLAQEKLDEERTRHLATLARLNELRGVAEAAQKETARLKARVQRGVCPCCKRSFPDLKRHMQTKHPEKSNAKA